MTNYLNVPSDLVSLIEKREQEDRRVADRRAVEETEASLDGQEERRKHDRRTEVSRRANDE